MSLEAGSDFHFFFVLDRSGSMRWANRIGIALEAMDLFMRSLPQGCKFSILSFGSQWSAMDYEGSTSITNEDASREFALN